VMNSEILPYEIPPLQNIPLSTKGGLFLD